MAQDARSGTSNAAKLVFMVEDTNDGAYRDVANALVRRGWQAIPFKKPSKQQSQRKDRYILIVELICVHHLYLILILFRIVPKIGVLPCFVWTINERDIPFADLYPFQIVNHFQGISKLTTKQGLCEILRETSWVDCDMQDISPR